MDNFTELENHLASNLKTIRNLKNEVEKKENEKHDQLKMIAIDVIHILDSIESMEEGYIEKGIGKNEEVFKILERYRAKLLNLLNKQGIQKLEFSNNKLIVGLCEVVETIADNNKINDEIVTIVRNGYIRGKESIRDAQLIIVKN
jgi:molecular chaperone GrpE (heat shock protein)